MKPTFQKDDALLADIARARSEGRARLWWLGQSGFLLHTPAGTVLFDPYLSDSLTTKYAGTDKPHTRVTERVIAPERLTGIDVITSSHNHTDHLDAETLLPLLATNPQAKLVIPRANRDFVLERLGREFPLTPTLSPSEGEREKHRQAAGKTSGAGNVVDRASLSPLPRRGGEGQGEVNARLNGCQLVELDEGESASVAGVEFHGIPAAHNTVERDEQGRCRFLGYVARVGGKTIYHSGDTLMHDGLVPALARFAPDVALVPINGNRPERRVAGNLNGREAAGLARAIGARLAVPHHFDLFAFNTEPPDEFEAACHALGQPFRTLQNGEGVDL